jgi:hypothetical protein
LRRFKIALIAHRIPDRRASSILATNSSYKRDAPIGRVRRSAREASLRRLLSRRASLR